MQTLTGTEMMIIGQEWDSAMKKLLGKPFPVIILSYLPASYRFNCFSFKIGQMRSRICLPDRRDKIPARTYADNKA